MGCGSSQSASTSSLGSGLERPKKDTSATSLRKQVLIGQSQGGEADDPRADSRSTGRDSGIDSAKTSDGRNAQQRQAFLLSGDSQEQSREDGADSRQIAVPTPVAFEVDIGEHKAQSIVKQHPPKQLQMKVPEGDTPKVTAEILAERQRVADERRFEEMRKRAKSAKQTSRRRKDILAAKEFGEKETIEAHQKKLEEKVHSAEQNKSKHNAENQAKQKLRELKRAQTREKAKRLNQMNHEEQHFDMEKDETFNAEDDADSWLDGGSPANPAEVIQGSASTNNSERIYDGRSSPTKRFQPLTSAEARRRQHSLDMDSGDEASDGNQWASHAQATSGPTGDRDNFFDT